MAARGPASNRALLLLLLAMFLAACVINVFIFAGSMPRELHSITRRTLRTSSALLQDKEAQVKPRALAPMLSPPLLVPAAAWRIPGCQDTATNCKAWAENDGCLTNSGFMLNNCKDACGMCDRNYLISVPEEVRLTGNVSMPTIGFGTAGMGQHTQQAVAWALQAGFRLVDSAQAREWYREDLVSAALKDTLRGGRIERRQLFITSKLHPRHHGYTSALAQLEKSLEALGTDYLDLMLLHYPDSTSLGGQDRPQGTWKDSWHAFEQAVKLGKLRAIGVSNFDKEQLQELQRMATVQLAVVQSHCDPFAQARQLRAYCRLAGIQFQAYSSLGTQWLMRGQRSNPVFNSPVIKSIAAEVNRSAAQVVLRWALQSGQAVIPQSSNRAHIKSNRQLRDFSLTPDMLQRIDALDGSMA